MDGSDEYVTETLKMIIKVFWCSGDESSCSIITNCFLTMNLRTHYLKTGVMTLDLLSEYFVALILMLFSNTISAIRINKS
jgi:hypothetical protein